MKTFITRSFPFGKGFLIFALMILLGCRSMAQCGFDFFIANDQSGSVDAKENLQSRQFIERLALSFSLGNDNNQSRAAIASWSSSNEFQLFSFPAVGAGYTTQLSDIVTYRNSPQLFANSTDPYNALQKSWQYINLTPVTGRDVRKILVLMTDASSLQINPSAVSLASTIKAAGIYIIVLGIDQASSTAAQVILQQVASPGGNFSAVSYQSLINNSISTIQGINTQLCPGIPVPFDLNVLIDSYNCSTGQVNYTVFNNGATSFGPAALNVSFYTGRPNMSSSVLLATHQQSGVTLPSYSSHSYSFTNSALIGLQTLSAVVNVSTSGTNAVPPLPYDLSGRLLVIGEGNAVNNVSPLFTTTDCGQSALLNISNAGSMGCNNLANYQVQVSNAGAAAADIQSLNPLPPAGFAMQYGQMSYSPTGCSTLSPITQRRWGTYFGGDNSDHINNMAVDAAGNIYITGYTTSAAYDGFVAKFDSTGVQQWSTYFGGGGNGVGQSIAVDASGNVYIAGYTTSTIGIESAGAFQTTLKGGQDAFLIKFDGSTGARLWGTYYGDTNAAANEGAALVTVSGSSIYFAMRSTGTPGATASNGVDNLTTNGTTHAGGMDIILVKFDATGARQWATLFGGTGDEDIDNNLPGYGDIVANSSSVFFGGSTTSPNGSGLATAGAWDVTYANNRSGMLARFNPADGSLYWSTYIDPRSLLTDGINSIIFETPNRILVAAGASIYRFADAGGPPILTIVAAVPGSISIDAAGNIYTVGTTAASSSTITTNAYQPVRSTGTEIYFAMYNSNLKLQYGSYFGDFGDDYVQGGRSSAIDVSGNLIFAGFTKSTPGSALRMASPGSHKSTTSGPGGSLEGFIERFSPFTYKGVLSPGCTLMLNYVYDASAASNGTYQSSFGVTAAKVSPTDSNPVIFPNNTNFSVSGYTGNYNGFNGALNTSDDVIKTGSPCTLAVSPVTIAVSFGGSALCSQSFGTATVIVNNPNSSAFTGASVQLNLTGTGSVFSGEPYNFTNGLQLQGPDLSSPAYPTPGVPGQLNGKTGSQALNIYSLPAGTSTFQVDVSLGSAATNLAAMVVNLPDYYNALGNTNSATGAGYSTPAAIPTVNINCPGSINAGSSVSLSGTSTGASSIQWSSSSNNNITNTGTVAAPTATYTPSASEVAAGFAEIALRVVNTSGCDDEATCRVIINNVQRDFGDAPSSFDLGSFQLPVAAGSTALSGFYIGTMAPDMEGGAQASVSCTGDGDDEDGLKSYDIPRKNQTNWQTNVQVTNNAGTTGYLTAFIDWNGDGDFLDSNESSSVITIPASAGTKIYTPSFTVPAVVPDNTFMRLRLSTDQQAVQLSYGGSPEGEVEDYLAFLAAPLQVNFIDFNATKASGNVVLTWHTSMEINHNRFDVERSQGGKNNWQKIGEVTASGNSGAATQSYRFTDYHPYNGFNYYRLREVDMDGKSTNSAVRTIHFETNDALKLYPNPAKDRLFLNGSDRNDRYDMLITDVSGVQIMQAKNLASGASVSMTALPAGMYIVRVTGNDKLTTYYKICKQ